MASIQSKVGEGRHLRQQLENRWKVNSGPAWAARWMVARSRVLREHSLDSKEENLIFCIIISQASLLKYRTSQD